MSKFRALVCALAALPLSTLALGTTATTAAAKDPEVIIKVTRLRALDQADAFSKGDFYAKVTINGEAVSTPPVKQEQSITPDWIVSKKVKAGVVKVNLAVFDKDVSVDDPIDINRLDNKRDLDFTVNTKTCKIEGFSSTYKCGAKITRAGKEKKDAEVTFIVTVKK
jgi:hypothetical protein